MSTSRSTSHILSGQETTHFVNDCSLPSYQSLASPNGTELGANRKTKKGALRHVWNRTRIAAMNNSGLLLVAAAQGFFALTNLTTKILRGIHPLVPTFELIALQMGMTYGCTVTYMYLKGIKDPMLGPIEVRVLLIARGFCGFFGIFGVYYSLIYLSLSDATVLTFLSPLLTAIVGGVCMGEHVSYKEILAGLVSLSGVILVARPAALFGNRDIELPESDDPRQRLVAVGFSMLGVLGSTGAFTTIRAIGTRAHALHSLVFFSMASVFMSCTCIIITKTPVVVPGRLEWLVLLCTMVALGWVGQALLAMGLQRETAGRGSMGVYTQVIFAVILERIFFHALPSLLSGLGAALILTSAIYTVATKKSPNVET